MKAKLLKKCRQRIKFYERNGRYYVDINGNYTDPIGKTKEAALSYYRLWILRTAQDIFKFKFKNQFFKY